jgi:hypothetical protein
MDDLISKQAVLDGLASIAKVKARSDAQKSLMGRAMFFVEKLPPVTPQPKIGHWEWVQYDSNSNIGNWHCSECKAIVLHMPELCPMCGAKMLENPTGLESEET